MVYLANEIRRTAAVLHRVLVPGKKNERKTMDMARRDESVIHRPLSASTDPPPPMRSRTKYNSLSHPPVIFANWWRANIELAVRPVLQLVLFICLHLNTLWDCAACKRTSPATQRYRSGRSTRASALPTMSDNAGSNDIPDGEVHGEPSGQAAAGPSDFAQPDSGTGQDDEGVDLDASLGLAAALGSIPPADDEMDAPEIDPDTLANLAALSRITNDDEEGGNEGEGEGDQNEEQTLDVAGDSDFGNLGSLTGEQVQEIVDSLGDVHPRSDDQDAESPPRQSARQSDDESERDDNDDGSRPGDDDYRGSKFFDDGKQKRRRNRTVLWVGIWIADNQELYRVSSKSEPYVCTLTLET